MNEGLLWAVFHLSLFRISGFVKVYFLKGSLLYNLYICIIKNTSLLFPSKNILLIQYPTRK